MSEERLTRRHFLGLSAALLCGLPACATTPTHRVLVEGGRVVLARKRAEALVAQQGAILLGGEELPEPIVLLRAQGTWRAIGARCTHLGCQVRPSRHFLVCPCHGSTFDLEGEIVRGPAPRRLSRYPLITRDETIEIRISPT